MADSQVVPGAWWWATWRPKRPWAATLRWCKKTTPSRLMPTSCSWSCTFPQKHWPPPRPSGVLLIHATPGAFRRSLRSTLPPQAPEPCWKTSDTGNAAHSSVAPIQAEIIQSLGVADGFDAYRELAHRSQFLADYLQASGLRHFVVGISGGIDSLVAGLLARSAISM